MDKETENKIREKLKIISETIKEINEILSPEENKLHQDNFDE